MKKKEGLLKGIFTSPKEESFVSDRRVKRDLAIRGELPGVEHKTPPPCRKTADEWLRTMSARQKQIKECSPRSPNHIRVRVPHNSIINFSGDQHIAGPDTDHEQIRQELAVIKNSPRSFLVALGDMVDGFFWGGQAQSEQLAGIGEQHQARRSILKEMKGRVIAGISGEHDSKWPGKSGPDPYDEFSEETGGHYIRGVAEIDVECGDQNYKIVAAHKLPGHSMYNKNHPTFRASRVDGVQGADVYVSAHRHRKQVAQEAIREFGNKSRVITHIAVGPYKPTDEYCQRAGFPNQTRVEQGGVAIRLSGKRKKVDVEMDIVEAHKRWRGK